MFDKWLANIINQFRYFPILQKGHDLPYEFVKDIIFLINKLDNRLENYLLLLLLLLTIRRRRLFEQIFTYKMYGCDMSNDFE